MRAGEPSRTAWAAAFHRAAHQVLDQGSIFSDPLAVPIFSQDTGRIAQEAEERATLRIRTFIAVRTRFAEDSLAAAYERGVRQLVILGAGFDTYAYRGSLRERVRIWEVDHPATQEWKRRRLAEVGIAVPGSLTFAPVDFESQTLAEGLEQAGFDTQAAAFFTWLGVVPYLTRDAIRSTLGYVAGLPGGAHAVFDYADPPHTLPPEVRAAHDLRAARVAQLGEPFQSFFDPGELRIMLTELGFREVEDLGPRQIAARYFPDRPVSLPDRGGHVVRVSTR